jgi:hypothetical protein
MKLEAESAPTASEDLVGRERGGTEAHPASRNLENIAMPVRGRESGWKSPND